MANLRVGDKVRISDRADHVELNVPRRMRALVGTVIEVDRGAVDVRFPGLDSIYEFYPLDLDLVEEAKSLSGGTRVKSMFKVGDVVDVYVSGSNIGTGKVTKVERGLYLVALDDDVSGYFKEDQLQFEGHPYPWFKSLSGDSHVKSLMRKWGKNTRG